MIRTKTLTAIFNIEIEPWEITAFRGAVAHRVGKDESLFHNHIDDKFVFSYPLIQYKRIKNKAAIFCIGAGAEHLYKLFEKNHQPIHIGDQKFELEIERLDLKTALIQVWDKSFTYKIKNWLGLNSDNYKKYHSIDSLGDQIKFLEKTLTNQIINMAKGIGWTVENAIQVAITEIETEKVIRYKDLPYHSFDLTFKCNVSLPPYIGLGKAPSHGFGIVYKINTFKFQQENDTL
jgi:hypothetical protein